MICSVNNPQKHALFSIKVKFSIEVVSERDVEVWLLEARGVQVRRKLGGQMAAFQASPSLYIL